MIERNEAEHRLVEGKDLTCIRGGRMVFSQMSFSAGRGELLAIRGANGCGKTSLLRIVGGLLTPAEGRLRVFTDDDRGTPFHYLGHADGLKGALSVRSNLGYWRALYGASEDDTDQTEGGRDEIEAARVAGIDHLMDLPVSVLSAGQRRRTGLARLLMVRRPIWLLDEPTSSLDSDGVSVLGSCMAAQLARGGTILAATHEALPVTATGTIFLDGGDASVGVGTADPDGELGAAG